MSGGEQSNLRYVFACACDAEQVPRIAELRETVTGIKNELVEQTSQAFNQVGQLASSTADPEGFHRDADVPGQFRSLQEACLVVDALGGQARQQQVTCLFKVFSAWLSALPLGQNLKIVYVLYPPSVLRFLRIDPLRTVFVNLALLTTQIESFCNQQMQPYDPLFPQGSTQAGLDQIDRRFAWFRRLLRGVDLRFDGVFPKHWRLQHRLCMRFLAQTRTALAEMLEGGSKEAEDVTVLLKVGSPLGKTWLLVVPLEGCGVAETTLFILFVCRKV